MRTLRTGKQLLRAFKKATAQKPLKLHPDEFRILFDEQQRELRERKFIGKKIFADKNFYANMSMKEYISPLSGELITSKVARREEMKKFGVREVDPSETMAYKRQKEQNG